MANERSLISWLGIIADIAPVGLKYRALTADQRRGPALKPLIVDALDVLENNKVTPGELAVLVNSPGFERLLALAGNLTK
jgi:hypothetical protein